MRYLVFDIECCDGKNICEFGYVIANENFEITEKEVLLINPVEKFNLTGRSYSPDITLYYTEEQYYNAPKFPVAYKRIKSLLERADQIVIGYSISNDIKFLRTACKKYKLPPIEFSFVDSQRVYGEFFNIKNRVSLANAEVTLELSKPEYLHKSDDDAKRTLELVQKICDYLGTALQDLHELCPIAFGKCEGYLCKYEGSSLPERIAAFGKNPDSLSNNQKEKLLKDFIKNVRPQGTILKSEFNNTTLCFSKKLEKYRTKDVIKLIQLLKNAGCKYDAAVGFCNYYVAADEELQATEIEEHSRYYAARYGENSDKISIISFDELLSRLSLTENDLEAVDMPTLDYPSSQKNENKEFIYSTCKGETTLGDYFKAKGIDLFSLINS